MKAAIIISLIATLFLTGCFNTPIATKVEGSLGGSPFSYKSEKDVLVERELYDAETGNLVERTKIEANASNPAAIQAERDKVQAEANKAAMDLATKVLSGATPGP